MNQTTRVADAGDAMTDTMVSTQPDGHIGNCAEIEMEMFEVGLGSSIYTRLRRDDGDVRILADGGVERRRGFTEDHVLNKLVPLLKREGADRLDLVIGTHYDEDHLRGLIPIVRSEIEIGELWLPPVADDAVEIVANVGVQPGGMLGARFEKDEGYLNHYVGVKLGEIVHCLRLEAVLRGSEDREMLEIELIVRLTPEERRRFLDAQMTDAYQTTDGSDGDGCEHFDVADVDDEIAVDNLRRRENELPYHWYYGVPDGLPLERQVTWARDILSYGRVEPALFSIRQIRRAAAKDAINATALHELVQAAKAAKVTIRYNVINVGRPDAFHWDAGSKSFRRGRARHGDGTTLSLLGPSQTLVRKHANRLPVAVSTGLAMISRIPVKGISPSNQLSYVVRVAHADQNVLICGDSGFSDFMVTRSKPEPLLLAELVDLDVVQVAHHGGANQWFYPVLIEAWLGRATPAPLLQLSHATLDKHRPSDQFARFVEETSEIGAPRNIVFTSQPLPEKVEPFRDRVCLPKGSTGPAGDVRLECRAGQWNVARHAIAV